MPTGSATAWFLLATLALTAAATALLCAAMMTDRWEQLSWSRARLNQSLAPVAAEWLLGGRVARLVLGVTRRLAPGSASAFSRQEDAVFLVPTHGGIWTLCTSLTEEQQQLLSEVGFTRPDCVHYLSPEAARPEESRPDWQHRMQNLSISCALVCLIVLGSAALVGAFGVLRHQISAVLITGVMYLLAATFAMFTLTIMHFKRAQGRAARVDSLCVGQGADEASLLTDGVSPSGAALERRQLRLDAAVLRARLFAPGWSVDLGWGGVALCAVAAVLWLLLSKIMRYRSPLASLLPA
ncbi:uncharacterized protein LOC124594320 [Schistocerca americana]|nr:uncharacterized protein LOC124594320 [Schistocerca americana]XP_047106524.1 uncharacterized protein LOC124775739 [Schistocerca piceifrons]XP_049772268.1 uncharacterized protein LOC126156453 [Schistocerca cancellata]